MAGAAQQPASPRLKARPLVPGEQPAEVPLCSPRSPLGFVTRQLLPAGAQRRLLLILAPCRSPGSTCQDFSLFFWWHFHVTLGEIKQKTHLLLVK